MALMQFDVELSAHILAVSSTCTALFAGASLRFIRQHVASTRATVRATHEAALSAYEEGARPVLILIKVTEHGTQRQALFRNTGVGVAMNISQTNIFTTYSDDNVLAPNQQTSLLIPLHLDMSVIEVRYESLTGKKLCTISSFHKDGSIFNQYIPDARALGEAGIAHARGTCLSIATASQNRKLNPRPIHVNTGLRANGSA
jgi:hypothetical protein